MEVEGNAGLYETQVGIKTVRRNINNLRYTNDTTLLAESEEELNSLLMKVKDCNGFSLELHMVRPPAWPPSQLGVTVSPNHWVVSSGLGTGWGAHPEQPQVLGNAVSTGLLLGHKPALPHPLRWR